MEDHGEDDRKNETVLVSDESDNYDEKNEDISKNDAKTKKRMWTDKRQAAWEKCQEGRKNWLNKRKEIIEKEAEDRRLKDKIKLEMLKEKIKKEIEDEIQNSKQTENKIIDVKIENKDEIQLTKDKKKKRKKEISESESSSSEEDSSSSSSSEEEKRKKKRKKSKKSKKIKKRKYYYSSDNTDSQENYLQETTQHPVSIPQHPVNREFQYLKKFHFV